MHFVITNRIAAERRRLPLREQKIEVLDLDEKGKHDFVLVEEGREVEGIIEVKVVLKHDMAEAEARREVLMAFQRANFGFCRVTLSGRRERRQWDERKDKGNRQPNPSNF